jgi:uncharacterized protein (DUF1697 family)
MAALREGLVAAGATDVATYVQSGNVVLTPPRAAGRRARAWLEETIGAIAGFEVAVVLRTAPEMVSLVERNPYPGVGGTRLHVLFCDPAPPTDLLDDVDLAAAAPEAASLVGADLYLHLPNGIGRATMPTLLERPLRRAGVTVTARNWNTVERLLAMLEER